VPEPCRLCPSPSASTRREADDDEGVEPRKDRYLPGLAAVVPVHDLEDLRGGKGSPGHQADVAAICNRAVFAQTPDFLELAGTVGVPATKRNVAWDEVIRRTRAVRAPAHR